MNGDFFDCLHKAASCFIGGVPEVFFTTGHISDFLFIISRIHKLIQLCDQILIYYLIFV